MSDSKSERTYISESAKRFRDLFARLEKATADLKVARTENQALVAEARLRTQEAKGLRVQLQEVRSRCGTAIGSEYRQYEG